MGRLVTNQFCRDDDCGRAAECRLSEQSRPRSAWSTAIREITILKGRKNNIRDGSMSVNLTDHRIRTVLTLSRLCSRIGDLCSADLCEWSQGVKARSGRTCDLPHFDSSNRQRIGNQGTVTPPWHSLRTHYCDALLLCEFYQLIQIFLEFCSLHVIGIAAETRVVPTHVYGVRLRMPEATQTRHIAVMNTRRM